MVTKYNEAALSSGLNSEQASAIVGDLFANTVSPTISGPEYQNFDIAVIALGFHHFEDPALAVKRIAERLKPGVGTLLILDFLPSKKGDPAHTHHPTASQQSSQSNDPMAAMRHTIKHDGFDSEMMCKLYEAAGMEFFGFDVLEAPFVMEFQDGTVHRTGFLANGKKPRRHGRDR